MDIKKIIDSFYKNFTIKKNNKEVKFFKENKSGIEPIDIAQKYAEEQIELFLSLKDSFSYVQDANGNQYFDFSGGLEFIKQTIHLLPNWKEQGLINYNNNDFKELFEKISSELNSKDTSFKANYLYNIDVIRNCNKELIEYLSFLKNKALDKSFDTDIADCLAFLNEIESILNNTSPIIKDNTKYVNTLDNDVINNLISQIEKTSKKINNFLELYKKASLNDDKKLMDELTSYYGIKSQNHSMFKLTGLNDLTKLADKLSTWIDRIKNSECLPIMDTEHQNGDVIDQLHELINNVELVKETKLKSLSTDENICQNIASNPIFNNMISGVTPLTEDTVEEFVRFMFSNVEKVFNTSYLGTGTTLDLEFISSLGNNTAGRMQRTNDNKSKIFISKEFLQNLVRTNSHSTVIIFTIDTLFHESGHAIHEHWKKMINSLNQNNNINSSEEDWVTNLIRSDNFDGVTLQLLGLVSPTLGEEISNFLSNPELKDLSDTEKIKQFAKKFKEAMYLYNEDEMTARLVSEQASIYLYQKLNHIYSDKNNPCYDPNSNKSTILEKLIKFAPKICRSSYQTAEELENYFNFADIRDNILKDSQQNFDLFSLNNLCVLPDIIMANPNSLKDFETKRHLIFKNFYNNLPVDKKEELFKKSLTGGYVYLTDTLLKQNDVKNWYITKDDVLNYITNLSSYPDSIANTIYSSTAEKQSFLQRLSQKVIRQYMMKTNNEEEFLNQYEEILSQLIDEKNIAGLYMVYSSISIPKLENAPELITNFVSSLTNDDKLNPYYESLLLKINRYSRTYNSKLSDIIQSELNLLKENKKSNTNKNEKLNITHSNIESIRLLDD